MGIVFISVLHDKNTRQDFWKRLIDFRRISLRWYFLAILLPPILWLVALAVDVLLGGQPPAFPSLVNAIAQPVMLIPLFVPIVLFGPLSEKLGWRGYVLDRLHTHYSPLVSSCILGLAWALWHLPLFWVRGSDQYNIGLFTFYFWVFFLYVAGHSFLIDRAYNENNRSTLAAILMHFSGNLMLTLAIPFSGRAYLFAVVLFWLAANILRIAETRRPAVRAGYSPKLS